MARARPSKRRPSKRRPSKRMHRRTMKLQKNKRSRTKKMKRNMRGGAGLAVVVEMLDMTDSCNKLGDEECKSGTYYIAKGANGHLIPCKWDSGCCGGRETCKEDNTGEARKRMIQKAVDMKKAKMENKRKNAPHIQFGPNKEHYLPLTTDIVYYSMQPNTKVSILRQPAIAIKQRPWEPGNKKKEYTV